MDKLYSSIKEAEKDIKSYIIGYEYFTSLPTGNYLCCSAEGYVGLTDKISEAYPDGYERSAVFRIITANTELYKGSERLRYNRFLKFMIKNGFDIDSPVELHKEDNYIKICKIYEKKEGDKSDE